MIHRKIKTNNFYSTKDNLENRKQISPYSPETLMEAEAKRCERLESLCKTKQNKTQKTQEETNKNCKS